MKMRQQVVISIFLLLGGVVLSQGMMADDSCATDIDCQERWGPLSECGSTTQTCSNPFRRGCLAALSHEDEEEEDDHPWRVCNSDDITHEHCREPYLDYTEVRIFAGNWESSALEAWILQIALSELLGVPTTIESGTPDATMNLYESGNQFVLGNAEDKQALANGYWLGDCRLAQRNSESYEPCAHFSPESWEVASNIPWVQELVYNGTLEQPGTLGVLGEEAWFVTKFTAVEDPTLTSYLGLQNQREKLADLFLRPTTWKDYCDQVSPDQCETPNEVAQRAPRTKDEETRMFVEGVYTGHFRKTEENDCQLFPHSCTGHIGDYPCGWTSYVESQTYHLNISLQSSGSERNSRGYAPHQLAEMWRAANATRSNLMMFWWRPESLYQQFAGTEAEFQRVLLPPPSHSCVDARLTPRERCSDDLAERVGSPGGSCDESPKQLEKIMSTGLYRETYRDTIPDAIRNPAYDVLRAFRMSELQLGELLLYVQQKRSPREAACVWARENIDHLKTFLPRSYPRKLQWQEYTGLATACLFMACIAATFVIVTAALVFLNRKKRSIRVAQIEFLWLLLAGLFLVTLGAVLKATTASTVSCILGHWFVNIGYTLELIPLIVKVAAINRLNSAARKFRRVTLTRVSLFRTVSCIMAVVVVFLILWTTLDPPGSKSEYQLTSQTTDAGETLVFVRQHCSSRSLAWKYAALAWHVLMLVAATVLAFQTRRVQKLFNECHTLAIMIYSHLLFVILRSICCLLSGHISDGILKLLLSAIFSLDAIITLAIYFYPKLLFKKGSDSDPRASWVAGGGERSEHRVMFAEDFVTSDRSACQEPASMVDVSKGGIECLEDIEEPEKVSDKTEQSAVSRESQSSSKFANTSLWI